VNQSSQPSDIELLSATFPGWTFTSAWITAATSADRRRLIAVKDEVTLSAWTADDLAAQVTAENIAAALREDEQ
jgi:hypothetical protein